MSFINGSERSSIILQLHISCSGQVDEGMRGGLFCFADSQFLSFYKCMKYEKCGFRVMGI